MHTSISDLSLPFPLSCGTRDEREDQRMASKQRRQVFKLIRSSGSVRLGNSAADIRHQNTVDNMDKGKKHSVHI